MVSRALLALVLVVTLAGSGTAQSPVDSVRSLDRAWARAYVVHDTILANALFADDFVMTTASGALKDKAGELADRRPQPNLVMADFRTGDVVVRMYGPAAVVTGLAEWRFSVDGRVTEVRRRYTSVFVAGGPLGWRMSALHMGRAP